MTKNILLKVIVASICISSILSCGKGAGFHGTLTDASEKEIVVKLLDVNKYKVLDTLMTDKHGNFKSTVEVEEGQPEFVYLYSGDTKVASLLLQKGDKVTVTADTLGTAFTVSGSPEAEKLAEVEKSYADFISQYSGLVSRIADLPEGSLQAKNLTKELLQCYLAYHRDRVKYVLTNSKSLTVVPVLFQTIGNAPLFSQHTDAMLFSNAADSLETVYPDSKYVKALRNEAQRRNNLLGLSSIIDSAPEIGFLDVELPDINGKNVKLSDVTSKLTMVYFWSASDDAQKLFNIDVLKDIYKDYHSKGLEIYQASLSVDKANWVATVKGQGLDWVNVCDSRGIESPYIGMLNIPGLPFVIFIYDGNLVQDRFGTDDKGLRKLIEKYL